MNFENIDQATIQTWAKNAPMETTHILILNDPKSDRTIPWYVIEGQNIESEIAHFGRNCVGVAVVTRSKNMSASAEQEKGFTVDDVLSGKTPPLKFGSALGNLIEDLKRGWLRKDMFDMKVKQLFPNGIVPETSFQGITGGNLLSNENHIFTPSYETEKPLDFSKANAGLNQVITELAQRLTGDLTSDENLRTIEILSKRYGFGLDMLLEETKKAQSTKPKNITDDPYADSRGGI